jgi:phosphoglycerate kinase
MKRKLSLKDLDVKGKKILMRVDFNVPLDKRGIITDDTRIRASLPSIEYVLDHGGSVILMSHLGRPKEKKAPEFSLAPCAKQLSELLQRPVQMAPDCVGPEVEKLAQNLKPGQVLLLENLRFHKGEEHPEQAPEFAKQLAKLGDVYVDDAFGTAHRAHASTFEVPKYFPDRAAAGFLMEKEIEFLEKLVLHPQRPFCAIIGGSKISTKIGLLRALLKKVDYLLIGGAMTYTFMKARGLSIGDSLYEPEFLEEAKSILAESKSGHAKLLLPVDHVITDNKDETHFTRIIEDKQGITKGFKGVDIGPRTIEVFFEALKEASTIFWNGPMGVFEVPKFATGTTAIAEILANSPATTIVGGGDSISALKNAGVEDQITHLSTGGGASLEYIELGTLPGIEVLTQVK